LIVHGGGGDHTSWAPLVSVLSPDRTVITFDRRGRGRSEDTLPYAAAREVEDIVTLVERLRPACVLGHSFGTFLALEAALASSAIPSVIGYESWPDPTDDYSAIPEWLPPLEALAAEGRRAEIVEYDEPPESVEELHQHWRWPEWLRGSLAFPREVRALAEFWGKHPTSSRRWHNLSIPILLLYGEQDVAQGEGALALAATLADARVEMLLGQGHRANYEGPEVLAAAVRTFV
jgi:pimeloyl-ACP methyl ester carboxylesterase